MRPLCVVFSAFALAGCGASSSSTPLAPAPPTALLASIAVSPTEVTGGGTAEGTVTLTLPAPANGASVTLSSNHPAIRVSPAIVVPPGATSATFVVTTETVAADTDAVISAVLGEVTKTATVRVKAPIPGAALVGLSTPDDDVVSGETTTGTISAASPAPAGGIRVDLASNDADLSVPEFVVIAAGTISASFEIKTSVVLVEKNVRMTATVPGPTVATASQVVAVLKLRPPPPHLASVSPSSASPGTSVNVTLTGAMFVSGATVSVSGSGLSWCDVGIDSLSSMRATLTISSSAAAGERQITVVTSGGSSSVAFAVGSAPPPSSPPTISSVQPSDIRRATSGGMFINGTNFTPGSTVSISGTGVTMSSVTYINSTLLATGYNAIQDAPLGTRTLTVTSAGGTSGGYSIQVLQLPSITSMSPTSGLTGTTVDLTISGRDFIAPVTVSVGGCSGTTISNVSHVSETQLTARLTIGATPGFCFVQLTSGGRSSVATFQVIPPPPTITAVTPNPHTGTGSVDLIISGTNLWGPVSMQVAGSGVTVQSAVSLNQGSVSARVLLDANFTSGDRFITLTTSGGTSNAFKWTVNRPALSGGQ